MYLHKVGMFGVSHSNDGMNFFNQLLLLIIIKVHVPFGQASFAGTILDKDEPNLESNKTKHCQTSNIKWNLVSNIRFLITQIELEHSLSALLQLHLHCQLNT